MGKDAGGGPESPARTEQVRPMAGHHPQKGAEMRYLGYTLADPSIPIPPPTPEDMAKMGEFMEEANKAGVIVAAGAVTPLDDAVKIQYHNGEFTVLDGPFTEAKELVGGWALMECRDKAEVIEWTKRFLAVVGEGESTIRPVYGD
jgi:hypothetical protein